jgi:short-subunit dehydrogenase
MTFPYKVAAITGASSGIGCALAYELSKRGCKVALLARREDELKKLAGQCGGFAAPCDVTKKDSVAAALARVESELGPIDLLIVNAGVGYEVRPDNYNFAEVEHIVNVNVLGAMATIYAALPAMLKRGHGHIAGISSLASYQGLPGNGAYSASKAYFSSHLEALRIELRHKGIWVTTICPGFIATPLTSKNKFRMPFLMSAEKAARKIVRAIECKRRVYNFPWPMAAAIKLGRMLPRWLFDRVVSIGPVNK